MLNKIIIISFFISCLIILSSIPAFATNNTFSVYGTVLDDDGTPISGALIKIIEPQNNSTDLTWPGINSTYTDSQGNFQFVDITANSSFCTLTISYPDHKQYFPPDNSFRTISASGIQYVNVTRIKIESDAPPSTPNAIPAAIPTNAFLVVIALGSVCLYKMLKQH